MCVADTRPLAPDSFDPPITIDFVPPRLLPAQACDRSARPSPPDCSSAHRDSALSSYGQYWLCFRLARPGGNLMGVTVAQTDTVTKLLQLMRDVVPALRDACVIWSAVNPGTEFTLRDMKAAAQGIKLSLLPVAMSSATDVDPALASIARARPGALIVLPAAVPAANAERIGELAIQLRIPSIAANKALMERGLLMSYGADPRDVARRIPGYADRIVKGAKPADMPVERPTKLELAINMKTAKAIGLVIPQALLLRADELTSDALHVRRLAAQLRPLVVVAEPNDLAARSQPATRR